jgi:hypothetical protein
MLPYRVADCNFLIPSLTNVALATDPPRFGACADVIKGVYPDRDSPELRSKAYKNSFCS